MRATPAYSLAGARYTSQGSFHSVSKIRSNNNKTKRATSSISVSMAEKLPDYDDAVNALNTLQTPFKAIKEKKAAGAKLGELAVTEMREWVRRIGYKPSDFNRLNIVHVAGTKGKGTTCAFVNSILGCYRESQGMPVKVGLYTSPHLVHVRERIQINSRPISTELFTKYFFEVWNALEATAMAEGVDPKWKPVYFRFLTLLSLHVFMCEGVDAAVYEVGVGGAWDSTNVIETPAVTGITTLGIDHTNILGETIDSIAWHKAGIFKTGSPEFSVQQVPEAVVVLEERAREKAVELEVVSNLSGLDHVKLTPNADYQRWNASLAVKLAETVLARFGYPGISMREPLPQEYQKGLEEVYWPGRCETRVQGQTTWFFDGAHTMDSLKVVADWFAKQASIGSSIRVLIFNQQGRDKAPDLLRGFQESLESCEALEFTHVVFCTNITWKDSSYKRDLLDRNSDSSAVASMTAQKMLADTWKAGDFSSGARIELMRTVEDTVVYVRGLVRAHGSAQVLATGSFRHVGGILAVLQRED